MSDERLEDTRCYHCGARIVSTQRLIAERDWMNNENTRLQAEAQRLQDAVRLWHNHGSYHAPHDSCRCLGCQGLRTIYKEVSDE